MSKANLLRHPLGVSMTTFKVPNLGSKGGNLLSKFIYLTSSRFPLKSRGPFPTFLEAIMCDGLVRCWYRRQDGSSPSHRRHGRLDLWLQSRSRFPKEIPWD